MYLFDKKTLGFFPLSLKDSYISAGTWPKDDGEVVDEDVFLEYTAQPPDGKIRASSPDGMPCWIDIPPLTHEQYVAIAEQARQQLLAHADATTADWRTELALGIISDGDKAKLITWMEYIRAVKAVDTSTAPDITWPVKPE